MNDFYSREPVPKWRIVLYGVLAAIAVAVVGYLQHDRAMYIMATIAGVFIIGFGLILSSARSDFRPIEAPAMPQRRSLNWIRWVTFAAVLAGVIFRLWIVSRKK